MQRAQILELEEQVLHLSLGFMILYKMVNDKTWQKYFVYQIANPMYVILIQL